MLEVSEDTGNDHGVWKSLYVEVMAGDGILCSAVNISIEEWKQRTQLSSRFEGRDVCISLFALMHIRSGLFDWTRVV